MKKDFRYDATLLSRASFPAVLEAGNRPCIVETTVYRLNAVAVTSLMLDGFDPLLNFIGLSPDDTYITQHRAPDNWQPETGASPYSCPAHRGTL